MRVTGDTRRVAGRPIKRKTFLAPGERAHGIRACVNRGPVSKTEVRAMDAGTEPKPLCGERP